MLSPCRHRVRSLIAKFFTQIEDAAKEQKIISKLGLQAAFKIENRLSKTVWLEDTERAGDFRPFYLNRPWYIHSIKSSLG